MTRTEFIQHIIDRIEAKSYLEIGTQYGYNYENIRCKEKTGVDPGDYEIEYLKMSSDQFFEDNRKMFDVIFVDGLHHHEQVIKDVDNALECLNENGVIVCHDCNPSCYEMQVVPEQHLPGWTGDVWRAWLNFRRFKELTTICFDVCTGMGFIQYKRTLSTLDLTYEDILMMTYENFDKKRVRLLNLKDDNYFKIILNRMEKV